MELGERIQKFLSRGSQKAMGVAGKIEAEVAKLTDAIKDLNDKKIEIEQLPMTKEEIMIACEKVLARGLQDKFIKDLLVPHLKEVQNKQFPFLWEKILMKEFTHERLLGSWLYAILTPELIAEAVKQLPDVGITEADRKKRIDAIDKEISALEEKLEKLLS